MDSHIQNIVDMIVIQGIKYGFAASACLDQFGLLQHAKLMGNGGLCQSQKACDVTNAKLGFPKRIENADPCGISEHLEKVRKIIKGFFLGHFLENIVYDILMDTEKFTFFNILFIVHGIVLSV
jgi:hypothetical protein